jgi:hypothetical protein
MEFEKGKDLNSTLTIFQSYLILEHQGIELLHIELHEIMSIR